jgi:hypothetical protein
MYRTAARLLDQGRKISWNDKTPMQDQLNPSTPKSREHNDFSRIEGSL